MKLYFSLSQASTVFKRKKKEVLSIISFNGQAYFVFRSNPNAEVATMIQAFAKIAIGNELRNQELKEINDIRTQNLSKFMLDAGVAELFPKNSYHAEENLIRGFPVIINKFKAAFPN